VRIFLASSDEADGFYTAPSGAAGAPAVLNERAVLANSGNFGIGTSTPDERLTVYNGSTFGRYTASGWTHSSDARLKSDIRPLEGSLEKILKLQGVEYRLRSDADKKKQIGLIAQEVEPYFPEVVLTDKEGLKSMVYSNLVAPIVESIKALYTKIVQIEEGHHQQEIRIESTSAELLRLRRENAAIKSYLCHKDPDALICR
jgi:hypothetical protein